MKIKKRKKSSRQRGASGGRTCGYGFRQKHKGHGNKGGFGFTGTGKKADHKKQKALMIAREAGYETYFGKRGFTSGAKPKKRGKKINLEDINKKIFNNKENKIDLSDYKILGNGHGFKAEISAKAASKSAIEKMEKAGGKILILGKNNIAENKGKNPNKIISK